MKTQGQIESRMEGIRSQIMEIKDNLESVYRSITDAARVSPVLINEDPTVLALQVRRDDLLETFRMKKVEVGALEWALTGETP